MLWIGDILVRIRIRGFVRLSYGSGFGSGSGSSFFRHWLTRCEEKKFLFHIFLLIEGIFTSVFIDNNSKRSRHHSFSYFFCLLMEGSGSVQNNEGSGSGRPKNIRIGIHNTGYVVAFFYWSKFLAKEISPLITLFLIRIRIRLQMYNFELFQRKKEATCLQKKSAPVFSVLKLYQVPYRTDILSYKFCYLFFVLFRAAVCIHLSNLST